jgi:tetratricopeptide (TPR) repeat protein
MSTEAPKGRGRGLALLALLVVVAAAAGGGVWWWLHREPTHTAQPDMVAVLHQNNLGVGYMEMFDYKRAVPAFEKVIEMAPDWIPGQINLGIALLNRGGQSQQAGAAGAAQGAKVDMERAIELFENVLQKDPNNLHARFCIGIIKMNSPDPKEAAPYFRFVTEKDPRDPHAWYNLGYVQPLGSPDRIRYYQKALELDPYLQAVIYGLGQELRAENPAKSKQLNALFEQFKRTHTWDRSKVVYTKMGRYAEVIGRPERSLEETQTGPLPLFSPQEDFKVILAAGTSWAGDEALGKGPEADLRRAVRHRFGGTLVVLDYDRDGQLDLLLLGAVVEKGKVRDLMLHREKDGGFRDVTALAGLDGDRVSLGCAVGDYDNDGYPDLIISGAGRQYLFHNEPDGKGGRHFVDVSYKAGLDKLNSVCLGATFVDLDNDGDLDLVLSQYAASIADALQSLQGHPPKKGPGLAVFLNIGEAPPNNAGLIATATTKFKRVTNIPALVGGPASAVNQTVSDLDCDHDLDLLVLADGERPTAVLDDRLLRFHRVTLPESLFPRGEWNGALVLDSRHTERSDLFLVGPKQRPVLLLNESGPGKVDFKGCFKPGAVDSPPLLQAQVVDLDLDSWPDIVGLSSQRRPVLLHNDGRRLVFVKEALGADSAWPKDLLAVTMLNRKEDCFPALLTWSASSGLQFYRSKGNGNHGLQLEITGIRNEKKKMRVNADAVGTRIIAQVAGLGTSQELTTLAGSLGQSCQPLLLGLGKHAEADVVRLRWPDNVWQAELAVPACQMRVLRQDNREPDSCPLLFSWDGERFVFVTDFLGAGSIGEAQPDGGHRPPRPEEAVKIEANQLTAIDGRYLLKIGEPMDEVVYLDRLQLLVVDHPDTVRVYPDERFTSTAPGPTQDLLAFDSRQEVFPVRATDHKGRDVTAILRHRDRKMVDNFACRWWTGFAEEHWVELDFGGRLAKFGPDDKLVLCLAGWTAYPYPESIWAAAQAGVPLQPPILERKGEDGRWHTVLGDPGFPAGLPRMMTVDVTGKLTGPRCVLRLRTNMQVYWDQVFVAPLLERAAPGLHAGKHFRVRALEVQEAKLESRGCMQEYSPDGRAPVQYDYDRIASVPVSRLAGKLTRLGDVTKLLRQREDCFVIFGPGDEVAVAFDATGLPKLPKGWTRSFVLRTWGYCKDAAPFTATGGTVGPLPFHGMSNFPYAPGEHYPRTPLHEKYRQRFNTRQVGPR